MFRMLARIYLCAAIGLGVYLPVMGDELTPVPIRAGVVALAPDSTRIEFIGTHVGPTPDPNARLGYFGQFEGQISVDVDQGALKEVVIEIDVMSIATFNPNLTNHLLTADFFNSKEYPRIKFTSSEIRPGDEPGAATIVGTLEMLGTSASIEIPVKYSINQAGFTLTAETTLRRSHHGMTKMLDRVNDEVLMKVFVGRPAKEKNEQVTRFGP